MQSTARAVALLTTEITALRVFFIIAAIATATTSMIRQHTDCFKMVVTVASQRRGLRVICMISLLLY
jgi:nicotinate-nucleotide pyrophosphorylase